MVSQTSTQEAVSKVALAHRLAAPDYLDSLITRSDAAAADPRHSAVEQRKMFCLTEQRAGLAAAGSQPSWVRARGQGEVAASQGASWCRQPAGRKDLEDGEPTEPGARQANSLPGTKRRSRCRKNGPFTHLWWTRKIVWTSGAAGQSSVQGFCQRRPKYSRCCQSSTF